MLSTKLLTVVGGGGVVAPTYYDLFTGTNNTLLTAHTPDNAPTWQAINDGLQIYGNAVIGKTQNANNIGVIDANNPDCTIRTRITYLSTSGYITAIVGRLTDTNNYWRIEITLNGIGFSIKKVEGGVVTTVVQPQMARPPVVGQTYLLEVSFSGATIIARFNGITLKTATATFNQTATKFGIYDYLSHAVIYSVDNRVNDYMHQVGRGQVQPSALYPMIIDSPVSYQMFQGDSANIAISGRYIGGSGSVEARIAGSSWSTIATGTSGTFSGNLAVASPTSGVLEVRLVSTPAVAASVDVVGVGDIFAIAGQSNASGYGGAPNNAATHASLHASLFTNGYWWNVLRDRTDASMAEVDAVSSDGTTGESGGTYWPILGTKIMAGASKPCAFIAGAKGGTTISQWLPGANHQDRTTLYGSLIYRCMQVGGVKAVLWHQGESDAASGTSTVDYNSRLDTLANAIMADLGVPLVAAKIHLWSPEYGMTQADIDRINNAIDEAIADNANVLAGPNFNSPNINSGLHWSLQATMNDAADRWWTALQTAFYT